MLKKITILFLLFLVFIPVSTFAQEKETQTIESFYAKAKVLNVNEINIEENINGTQAFTTKQEVKLKIVNSELKNKEFTITNEISNNPLDIKLTKDDQIIVNIEKNGDENFNIFIIGYYRLNGIILLLSIFFILLIILGGKQGIKTVLSLFISIILIFKILIPQIISGANPLVITLVISLFVIIFTFILIAGFNKKFFIAILGSLGGLIVAILISYIFSKLTFLDGLSTEESRTLFYKFPDINPSGIFFSGIIIAALGAVMDVAMSIASSLTEIKQTNSNIGFGKLFKSGINVGKDIMGTMSNTLIFAYVGVSLPLLILYAEYGDSYINFINLPFITDEIVRSIGGSIGLITVVPITALIGAILYSKQKT